MRKSILVLTAILAAGSFAQTSTADARGFRGGFGVAFSPVFGRHSGPDPSILDRAEHARLQQAARARADFAYDRRREAAAFAAAIRAANAAKAAKLQQAAVERRLDAAAIAAEKHAQRQARVAVKPVKSVQVVKAPIVVSTATAANSAASVVEAAQLQHDIKTEQRFKVPSTQEPVQALASPVKAETARPAAGSECKRFIAAAGATITVPCSE